MKYEIKEYTAPPKYKGDGVSIWTDKDKNGETYLKVKVLNGKPVNCFKR